MSKFKHFNQYIINHIYIGHIILTMYTIQCKLFNAYNVQRTQYTVHITVYTVYNKWHSYLSGSCSYPNITKHTTCFNGRYLLYNDRWVMFSI